VPEVAVGIAVGADGVVYVDDSGNARVEVFSPTGRFIRQFGSYGFGKGQIAFSFSIAVDPTRDVYLADDDQGTLMRFSPTGNLDWVIGGPAATDPDLVGHFHFTSSSIDSHSRLLTGNDNGPRVLYIDSGGHKVDAFGSPQLFRGGPCDVTVDAAGNTYVNSCKEPLSSPHHTEVFDRSHRLIGTWYPSPFAFAPAFGPHGEVFALGENGSILKLRINLPDA
jgi:DNA-binding beta-propeller fold protein YncE